VNVIPASGPTESITEHRRGDFLISTDRERLNLAVIHGFLTNCYWAKGISREVVARSIEHSLCFGIYDGSGAQVGLRESSAITPPSRISATFSCWNRIAGVVSASG